MDHQTNARRKHFATLFALPFDEVAVMLKNQSEEVIQDFINYLFDVLEYQTVSTAAPPEISGSVSYPSKLQSFLRHNTYRSLYRGPVQN